MNTEAAIDFKGETSPVPKIMIVKDVSRINEEQSDEEMCLDEGRAQYQRKVDASQVHSVAKMMKQALTPKADPYLVRAQAAIASEEID